MRNRNVAPVKMIRIVLLLTVLFASYASAEDSLVYNESIILTENVTTQLPYNWTILASQHNDTYLQINITESSPEVTMFQNGILLGVGSSDICYGIDSTNLKISLLAIDEGNFSIIASQIMENESISETEIASTLGIQPSAFEGDPDPSDIEYEFLQIEGTGPGELTTIVSFTNTDSSRDYDGDIVLHTRKWNSGGYDIESTIVLEKQQIMKSSTRSYGRTFDGLEGDDQYDVLFVMYYDSYNENFPTADVFLEGASEKTFVDRGSCLYATIEPMNWATGFLVGTSVNVRAEIANSDTADLNGKVRATIDGVSIEQNTYADAGGIDEASIIFPAGSFDIGEYSVHWELFNGDGVLLSSDSSYVIKIESEKTGSIGFRDVSMPDMQEIGSATPIGMKISSTYDDPFEVNVHLKVDGSAVGEPKNFFIPSNGVYTTNIEIPPFGSVGTHQIKIEISDKNGEILKTKTMELNVHNPETL